MSGPADLTLVTYSTGTDMVAEVLADWLDFLGKRPAEVLFAASADGPLPAVYGELVGRGDIDRLVEVPLAGRSVYQVEPDAVRQAVLAAATEWVLLIKLDTLPFRRGYDGWLAEDLAVVERDGLFGLTGGFQMADVRSLAPGYSVTQKYSNNFALFRRDEWLAAVDAGLGPAWDGPMAGAAEYQGDGRRFALEAAVERHLRDAGRRMLVRHESADWSVFHVNVWGEQLRRVRDAYRRRHRIGRFLNVGRPPRPGRHPWDWYYLYPKPSVLTRLRIWAGRLRRQAAGS